jgi:hypothetical protein
MVIDQFKENLAAFLGIDTAELYGRGLSLSQVLAMSPTTINSLDLVEAFATTIASLQLDDLIEIPPVTVGGGIDDFISALDEQLEQMEE